MKKKNDEITIRSSAAEYLTYVASVGDQQDSIEMRYEDENIWLTQKMMATLYDVDVRTINYHVKKIFSDSELQEESVIRNFRITAADGKSYSTNHYSLEMIIAVGFKVNSDRAVQFRKWVNQIAKDYTIKGWVMDDERLKNGGSVLTVEYFDRLIEQIREIRLSERRFYQKITDIYATALDYDRTAKTTKQFFAKVQNKMHSVNDDLSMRIRNDVVRIRVAETKEKIKHEITRQEAQALLKYEDEIKRHSWASKPQIRQYDYIYNGKLRIVFGEKSYIRDSEKEKLEDRLGDILISLYEKSEENRIVREQIEEEQRKREEEASRQEEIRKRKDNEIRLTKELANKAEDYRIASEIRTYIKAMIENENEEATPEWIEWASRKADWYDPTKDVEDEYLGKREHGKNKEEKDIDKVSVKRGWYW